MGVQSGVQNLLTKRVERHGVASVALCGGEGEGRERGHRLLSQPAPRDWRPTKTLKDFEKTGSTVWRRKVSVSSVGLCALAIAMAARVSAMGPRCEGRGPGNCGSRRSCRAATGQARVRPNARPASIAARRHRKSTVSDSRLGVSRCGRSIRGMIARKDHPPWWRSASGFESHAIQASRDAGGGCR